MSAGGLGYRVLVVEDNAELAVIVKFKLRSLYDTECVYTGEAAIRKLERDRFDIVLLDIGLPDRSGLDLLSEIKRRWPSTQVIIMTGDSDLTRLSVAQQRGAIRYLVKPFEPKDVHKAVASAVELVEHWRAAGVKTIRSGRRS